jgi:hypothetical protein
LKVLVEFPPLKGFALELLDLPPDGVFLFFEGLLLFLLQHSHCFDDMLVEDANLHSQVQEA